MAADDDKKIPGLDDDDGLGGDPNIDSKKIEGVTIYPTSLVEWGLPEPRRTPKRRTMVYDSDEDSPFYNGFFIKGMSPSDLNAQLYGALGQYDDMSAAGLYNKLGDTTSFVTNSTSATFGERTPPVYAPGNPTAENRLRGRLLESSGRAGNCTKCNKTVGASDLMHDDDGNMVCAPGSKNYPYCKKVVAHVGELPEADL